MNDQEKDRRSGAIDKANSAINTAKNLRNAVKLIRTAATVGRTVAAAMATSEIWIPVVIAVVLVLIIIFSVLILFGGGGAGGFDSQSSQGGGGPIPTGGVNPGVIASCPVTNGSITTPSYQADSVNGHCSDNYGACDPNSRRAKSIDVSDSSQAVLPMIEGKTVRWAFVNQIGLQIGDCSNPGPTGCGKEFVFVNYLDGGGNWTLFVGHIGFTSMTMGQTYDSGTIIGGSATDHFHFSIGKDLSDPTSFPQGSTDTRPGWLAADIEAGMCVTSSNTASNTCTQQYEGTGYCTSSNLLQYFGNPTEALVASLICSGESGSDPLKFNDNCATNDYSVGLFQINAVAQCPGAYGNLSCDNLLSVEKRNVCENNWYDPIQNISKAKSIREEWGSWKPWGTWAGAGRIPPVKDILTKCGISY